MGERAPAGLAALLAALFLSSCVIRMAPAAIAPARSCILMNATADSVFVAAYRPPCNPGGARPAADTIRTWDLSLPAPCGIGGLAIDVEAGQVRLRPAPCPFERPPSIEATPMPERAPGARGEV